MIIAYENPPQTSTASAGTREWLEASRNMVVASYVGGVVTAPLTQDEEGADEPLFGSHLREAADAVKRLLN